MVQIVAGYARCSATVGAVPKFLYSFGDEPRLNFLATAPGDTIWCSTSNFFHVFASDGNFLRSVVAEGLNSCSGFAFDCTKGAGEERVYCSELKSSEVVACKLDGSFIARFTFSHSRESLPWWLAVNTEGQLFVSDRDQACVHVLARDGSPVRSFGGAGYGDGQFVDVRGIAISEAGEVFVADKSRIQVRFAVASSSMSVSLFP